MQQTKHEPCVAQPILLVLNRVATLLARYEPRFLRYNGAVKGVSFCGADSPDVMTRKSGPVNVICAAIN